MFISIKRIKVVSLCVLSFAVYGFTVVCTDSVSASQKDSVIQVATVLGEVEPNAGWQASWPACYPLQVESVKALNETEMSARLKIQNLSNVHLKNMIITIMSPGYDKGIQFEVKEWKPNECIYVDYQFPGKEQKVRITELRVVNVSRKQKVVGIAKDLEFTGDIPTVVITDRITGTSQPENKGLTSHDKRLERLRNIDYSSIVAERREPKINAKVAGRESSGFLFRFDNAIDTSSIVHVQSAGSLSNVKTVFTEYEDQTGSHTEKYQYLADNSFLSAKASPLSTFSIDVDRASYANVRSYLDNGSLPPKDAVRIEELINYFSYDYPEPRGIDPFSVNMEVAECPWELEHRLVRIGIKGKEIDLSERPSSNLVFLLDVSGSMSQPNKLPLLKESLELLVNELDARDKVSIVVYAGSAGLVLPPTSGNDKNRIMVALDMLQSGGSTAGGAGINLAYKVARDNFIEGGVNRIILATDGDFNVGTSDTGSLTRLVEEKAKDGIYLSVLGFGRGNLNDEMMETITNKGNGNYAYIDRLEEAQKVLVEEMSGTLCTIAKDVKIQVEFNPAEVRAYRLVGYTNRMMANEDFNDDTKDAGEIGAGHTVTAFYEIIPPGAGNTLPDIDKLKYQDNQSTGNGELLTVKLRYKNPDEDVSNLIEKPVVDRNKSLMESSDDFIFAASVASFGMLLRDSEHQGLLSMNGVKEIVSSSRKSTTDKDRIEFLSLIDRAEELTSVRMKDKGKDE